MSKTGRAERHKAYETDLLLFEATVFMLKSIFLDGIFRYRVRTCFCLSEVQEYWLLIYSSNLSNQLIIFIHARSTTIADYSSINCLLQALVFLTKIGILSIVSGYKNSKLNIF